MWYRFACLSTSINLDEETRGAISEAAYRMAVAYKAKEKFKTEEAEGHVTTQFGYAVLGGISGMVFEAEVETDHGRGKIRYILKVDVAHEARQKNQEVRWDEVELWPSNHPGENAHLN